MGVVYYGFCVVVCGLRVMWLLCVKFDRILVWLFWFGLVCIWCSSVWLLVVSI